MIYEEYAHNQRSAISEPDLANLQLWAHVFAVGLKDFAEDQLRVEKGKFPREPSYWFWSHDNVAGSFEWCCDLLKIDSGRARTETLAQWRDLLPGSSIRRADTQHKNK